MGCIKPPDTLAAVILFPNGIRVPKKLFWQPGVTLGYKFLSIEEK
jgi:hypothetical protein